MYVMIDIRLEKEDGTDTPFAEGMRTVKGMRIVAYVRNTVDKRVEGMRTEWNTRTGQDLWIHTD